MHNKKASVLMISLWILSILVILAISLGHRAVISLKLARNQRDGLKAYLYAKSGIYKAVSVLKEDEKSGSPTKDYDGREECGVNLDNKEPQAFFVQEFENGAGSFKVGYQDSSDKFVYGMRDEDSKINININTIVSGIEKDGIIGLFTEKGMDKNKAIELVDTIIAWIGQNTTISKAKKENFNSLEELLLVFEYYYREVENDLPEDARKKAQATYAKIEDYLRVVGDKAGDNKININTALAETIAIFASICAKKAAPAQTDLDAYLAAANSLTAKLTDYLVIQPFKNSSELEVFFNNLTGTEEKNIAVNLKSAFKVKSNFFRLESTGTSGRIEKKITAIYDRSTPSFVYWKEN